LRKISILIIIGLIGAACVKNPFSTRDSDDPYGAAGTWETPQSPDVTVRNLLFAYNEMIISNYQLCFSDSFMFSSPEDSIDAVNDGREGLFANWDYATEIAVTNNIFSLYSASDTLSLFLTMTPSEAFSDVIEDTTAVLYRNYNLFNINTSIENPDTTLIRGLATFHLWQEELNWWTIYLWEDIPANSGEDDWGDLKGNFRQ
jgi:hypothetical protein